MTAWKVLVRIGKTRIWSLLGRYSSHEEATDAAKVAEENGQETRVERL